MSKKGIVYPNIIVMNAHILRTVDHMTICEKILTWGIVRSLEKEFINMIRNESLNDILPNY